MTVLAAAITKQDGVVIAADEEISWIGGKSHEGGIKLWVDKDHKFAFGAAGNIRAAQILRHWTEWPEFREHHKDIEAFVVKEVVPAMRESLSEHGALETSKKIDSFQGELIIAWDTNLIVVDEDFSITIPKSNRWAAGSGASEALGSMGDEGPWTKNDVIKAAKVATKTAEGVSGEIYYITTKSMEVKKSI